MAGNNSIQLLRGSSADRMSSGSTLLPGQPFYEWDTHKLYIGGSTSTSIAAAIPVSTYYDTVINNQTEFEAWYKQLDAGTYTGASVLILSGMYVRDDGKGLHLPATLKQLHGLGTVKIDITEFLFNANTSKGGIWYTTTPTTKEYSIENISLNCTGTGGGYGFYSCTNLINCTGTGNGLSYSNGYGFYECTNLTNCTGTGRSNAGTSSYGFYSCTNLTNCTGTGYNSTNNYGFYSCTNLTNCTGTGGSGTIGQGYGFNSCTNLTNCTGTGAGYNGHGFNFCTNLTNCTGTGAGYNDGYGFYSCEICSNCRQNPNASPKTSVWGGTNTNISKDTCPEYTA